MRDVQEYLNDEKLRRKSRCFREEIDMAGNAAKKKIQFLRQQTGAYFISAMLAGMFVGFGVLLAFTAGGMLKEGGVPGVKFIMGGCFGVASVWF